MENLANNLRKIKNDFALIGARVLVVPYTTGSGLFKNKIAQVNVSEDMKGEFFEITVSRDILDNLKVVNIDSDAHQLTLEASALELQFVCSALDTSLSIEYIYRPEAKKNSLKAERKHNLPIKLSDSYFISRNLAGLFGKAGALEKNRIN